MDAPAPGGLGGTYAGNPIGLRGGARGAGRDRRGGLLRAGQPVGEVMRGRLESLQSRVPRMAEVRGLGAMLAAEFCQPGGHTPDPDFTKSVQARALEKGLLLLTCGVYANVIRFLFPLTIPEPLFNEGLSILESVLSA